VATLTRLTTTPTGKKRQSKERARLLAAMPPGVDLDLAQVSSAARAFPADARRMLHVLVARGEVEVLRDGPVGRVRYRRCSEG